MKNLIHFFLSIAIISLSFNACIEEDFDRPPTEGTDPGLTVTTTIQELKDMHTVGDFTPITEDLIIKGVVIADDASGNWFRSFVLADETGGITVLVDIAESYVLYPRGREVYIKLNGLVMGDYNELIQIGGYIASDGSLGEIVEVTDHLIKSVSRGEPVPTVKTISSLSYDDVGSLIQLDDVIFLDTGGTYADAINQNAMNIDLSDCLDNTVLVRTSGFADFANEPVATGGGTFIGVLSRFRNDLQFLIRDLDDVRMNEVRCGNFDPCEGISLVIVDEIDENFQNGSGGQNLVIDGWTNFAVKGSRVWRFEEFGGDVFAQATAFGDGAPEMETWLVTPGIEATDGTELSFESAQAFWDHDGMTVWVSTDFVCDPTKAVWQPINCTLAGQSTPNYDWVFSGDIDLSGYAGKTIVIGFKYVGIGGNLDTSYRINDLQLVK